MEAYHAGVLPSLFTTILYLLPMFYFYYNHLEAAMLVYCGVGFYLLIAAFANKRYASELDLLAWKKLRLQFAKIFKLQNQKA